MKEEEEDNDDVVDTSERGGDDVNDGDTTSEDTVTFDSWMDDYDNSSWFWSMLTAVIIAVLLGAAYFLNVGTDDEDEEAAEEEGSVAETTSDSDSDDFDRSESAPGTENEASGDAEPVFVEDTVVGERRSWKEVSEPQPRLALVHGENIIIVDAFTFDSIDTIEVGFDFNGRIDFNAVNDNRHVMLTSEESDEGQDQEKLLIDVGTWSVPKDDETNHHYTSTPYVYPDEEFDEALELIDNHDYTTGEFDDDETTYSWLLEEEGVSLLQNGEEESSLRAGIETSDMLVAGLD